MEGRREGGGMLKAGGEGAKRSRSEGGRRRGGGESLAHGKKMT